MAEGVPEPGSPTSRPEICCNLQPGDRDLHRESLGSVGLQKLGSLLGVDGEPHRAAHNQGHARTSAGNQGKPPSQEDHGEVCTRLGGSLKEALGLSWRYQIR